MAFDQKNYTVAMDVDTQTGFPVPKEKVVHPHIKDYWSGSANVTHTCPASMTGLMISNDGAADLTVQVNGLTFTVKAAEVFDDHFDAFTQVVITTTSAYRAWARA